MSRSCAGLGIEHRCVKFFDVKKECILIHNEQHYDQHNREAPTIQLLPGVFRVSGANCSRSSDVVVLLRMLPRISCSIRGGSVAARQLRNLSSDYRSSSRQKIATHQETSTNSSTGTLIQLWKESSIQSQFSGSIGGARAAGSRSHTAVFSAVYVAYNFKYVMWRWAL